MATDTQLILNELKALRELVEERLPKKRRRSSPLKGKKKYGEHKHVLLKEDEHEELVKEYGEEATAFLIKVLDEYLAQSGKSYKDHLFMLTKRWPQERLKEWQQQSKARNNKRTLWQ